MAPGAPALTAEGNVPANNAMDPGEKVTFVLPLSNIGTSSTTNLTAELVSTEAIRSLSGMQTCGVMAPGSSVSRSFSFQITRGGCGTMANPILLLKDNGVLLGYAAYSIPLGIVTPYSFNGSSIVIRDDNTASPYPSSLAVSNIVGRIQTFTASLNGFSHTYPYDVGALLNGPDALQIVLFDYPTDTAVSNRNYTFTDNSNILFPWSGSSPSGSYRPTLLWGVSFAEDPEDEPAYTMSEFNGLNPNGIWRLYVEDFNSSDSGSISSWSLHFKSVNCADNIFFDATATAVSEGSASVRVDVIRSGGKEGSASVNYATANGTAAAGQDYTFASGSLTFQPGEWKKTIVIDLLPDAMQEPDETFTISLNGVSGSSQAGSASTHSLTIENDDFAGIAIAESGGATSVSEAGATDSYTVVLDTKPTSNVIVSIAFGSQLNATPGSLTFTPSNWNAPRSVTVTAIDDAALEGAHTGTLSHSSTSGDAYYNSLLQRLIDRFRCCKYRRQ
jgi:hypothetical protein